LLLAVAIAIAPRPIQPAAAVAPVAKADAAAGATAAAAPASTADIAHIQEIISQRCASCHSAQPTQPGFATAPAGMILQTSDQIRQHADKIYQQAVQLKAMPLANMTHITDEERALIGTWYAAGAK